ncbi:MAG: fatty acid desaturase [Cyclobacteriaceae bacterium]|nr:fatty acid desaturase [Cyclobacteriaceae bacterium]
MTVTETFRFSTGPEPHRLRTREIMVKHPEVRTLIGKNPMTVLAIFGLVGGMIGGAYLVKDASWWIVLLAAYLGGAFANHALFVMIHECTHHLLFKRKSWNLAAAIIANLPHTLPSAISFVRYHIKHHAFQGVHELDGDLPDYWEAKLINHSFLGKALWLLFFPVFQAIRTIRLKEIKPVDGWIVANWIVQVSFNVAIWMLFGPKAFFFLLFSFFFSVGLHPLGARWIQEHYLTLDERQETYSYYGPLNKVAFNVGFHNEHHDFPSIPWNKLPDLKKQAPEYYDSLKAHTSWTKLFFQFLFDKNISLYMRILRQERGKVMLSDESRPDVEMVVEARH